MPLLACGLNHRSAPLSLREQLVYPDHTLSGVLKDLSQEDFLNEAVILSTCNRTEIYADIDDGHAIIDWLTKTRQVDKSLLSPSLYHHADLEAVRHMMRVASGLDSMVLGEPQIFGQMKTAYQHAQAHGLVGSALTPLFQHVFSASKRVRTETPIGINPLSIGQVAVTLIQDVFPDLNSLKALLIGSGETIELVARHLHSRGLKQSLIANRTLENAQALAEKVGGQGVSITALPQHLLDVDIVVSATACPLPIIGKELLTSHERPMVMLDLAVPRDIEPEVGAFPHVHLYNIDNLCSISNNNLADRKRAAQLAELIIQDEVEKFLHRQRSRLAVTTIRDYRDQVDAIRAEELEKALRRVEKGEDAQTVLERFARDLTNKFLHAPTIKMRDAGAEGKREVLELARKLYSLDEESN